MGPPEAGIKQADGSAPMSRRGPVLWVFKAGYVFQPYGDDRPASEGTGDSTNPLQNPVWYDHQVLRLRKLPDPTWQNRRDVVMNGGYIDSSY